jgi:hypothetical protein
MIVIRGKGFVEEKGWDVLYHLGISKGYFETTYFQATFQSHLLFAELS